MNFNSIICGPGFLTIAGKNRKWITNLNCLEFLRAVQDYFNGDFILICMGLSHRRNTKSSLIGWESSSLPTKKTGFQGHFSTVGVANMITELLRFTPEVCMCNGSFLEMFKGEFVSAMRESLPRFADICLCNDKNTSFLERIQGATRLRATRLRASEREICLW